MNLSSLLRLALKKGASDVILSSGVKPCLKIDGEVVFLSDEETLDSESLKSSIFEVMNRS
jgi:Tfp pilus assembly pilus retraction ATPase PilT